MYKRLRNVNELTPTRMTLQLADRSIVYPKGILSDVALRVGKLVVPCDFVIMDITEDVTNSEQNRFGQTMSKLCSLLLTTNITLTMFDQALVLFTVTNSKQTLCLL